MALNFCVAHHSAKISSSKVSCEGYEATNLISSDERCRRRGFLAASFITPPVDIIVSFPHLIDISHVVVRLANGSQQTSSVRLYTRTSDDGIFNLIGGKVDITEPVIYFYNNRYKESYKFSSFSYSLPKTQRLYPKQDVHVSSVQSLKICLMRTARSTLPALSKLEVWGQPSKVCNTDVKQEIFQRELNARKSLNELSQTSKSYDDNSNDAAEKNSSPTKPEIPADFLDSITCEIMLQPVLLPSGNNVDRLTLEKYIETSATWGRVPGDPFTGVAFSNTNQPVPNAELKTRIDQFLLTNPNSCSGGRCIGFTSRSMLKFIPRDVETRAQCKSSSAVERWREPELSYKSISAKRRHLNSEILSSNTAAKKKRVSKETNLEHAKELAVSLKSSLKTVLDGRPSFLSSTKPPDVEFKCCIVCTNSLESRMYQLPCSHYLCRTCLLQQPKGGMVQCKKCCASFASSKVSCCYE